jgi:hypothetical protein
MDYNTAGMLCMGCGSVLFFMLKTLEGRIRWLVTHVGFPISMGIGLFLIFCM